jgi:hypothetical protein
MTEEMNTSKKKEVKAPKLFADELINEWGCPYFCGQGG